MVHHSQTLRTRYWYYEILILKPLAKKWQVLKIAQGFAKSCQQTPGEHAHTPPQRTFILLLYDAFLRVREGAVERFHTRKFELKVQTHHRGMRANPRSYRLAIPVGILVFDFVADGQRHDIAKSQAGFGIIETGDPCFEYFRHGIYPYRGIKYTASQKLGKLHSKDSGQIEEVDGNLYSRFPGESAKLGLLQHATPDRPVLLTNQDSNIIPGIFFIRWICVSVLRTLIRLSIFLVLLASNSA
ncbi:hypothetical protein CPSG_02450 [Coccidioides posadasii str. Silveira]|uniref:Uncharacterized protein n=1 Tax=Coccidioides posadasii (strain RMSCC 757 / Silveira) TaxID=443226 RepID=E9CZG3_COCPS|nr:hypothetical protein CPSG_02450 [Coccidioides posadasii str. Silveira]